MKYYSIEYNTDPKIVGTQYPQVCEFIKGYNPEPEAQGIFTLYETYKNGFPPKTPDLSGLKLSNGAQFSDFLSQPFTSDILLFSENAKKMLDELHIDGNYRVYPAQYFLLSRK